MSEIWFNVGFIRYPLTLSLLAVVALTLWSASRLFRANPVADLRTKAWVDAVFFWGGFAFIAGVLGTLIGAVIASQAIARAGAVSTALAWGGIEVALLSSAVGALILAFAALAWFALQLRWRLIVADRAGAATT